ncbi:GM11880 [Drosophila sechellia]|uniref:GM11880 n=1 Tax=Drosophila sechellia TaxID=7238 RepID=B4IH44_DROSE|nr:GM11880 [Drosophila sechellia]
MKTGTRMEAFHTALHLITIAALTTHAAQIPTAMKDAQSSLSEAIAAAEAEVASTSKPAVEPSVRIKCLSGSMLITIKDAPPNHETGLFSGMIYPKGLSKNSTCLSEYRDHVGSLRYKLPLRSCNTMPKETDDGGIEFFNTIVLQPHLKLITDLGRGYHVRCAYKSRDAAMKPKKYLRKHAQKPQAFRSDDRREYGRSLDKPQDDDLDEEDVYDANAPQQEEDVTNNEIPMPGCHMKIYNDEHKIADDVKIGDPLTIVISIDKQKIYGLHVTDCIVRDGLGWGEQRLVGEDGAPMDNEIMGQFNYTQDRLAANVTFPAHKFPYTTSVYYQCNVRLCALEDPTCQEAPQCSGKRPKRQAAVDSKEEDGLPATIEVFSGLYVNENENANDSDEDAVYKEKTLDDALCVSQRTFAIAIAIAGLILMLAVVAAVLCIMARRSTKTVSNSGSSIYSGPYTNTAFSHSS